MYSHEPHYRKRARISVRGIVQGIGFRPFVYQLATALNVTGWVRNTSGAVLIEAEGSEDILKIFAQRVAAEAPPLAVIEEISCDLVEAKGYPRFEILSSKAEEGAYQRISPDIPTCAQCLQEVLDPEERRSGYPFTNCTNCGPRFTIISDIPYDRPATTMHVFPMCSLCRAEYDDPGNRRFHAQPNCCPECGPRLTLVDSSGNPVSSMHPIRDVAGLLREGKIVAVKGLGGFLLACDATDTRAVSTLRERKHRPFKPFAVMMTSLEEAQRYCLISSEEAVLLSSPRAPIVLLRLHDQVRLAPEVAPNLRCLGVMLPYTPLHHLLLRETSLPLVMTSGNLSEEPIAKDNDEALERLAGIADYFLIHDRDIHIQFDDSVTIIEDGRPRVTRRARSYAPDPIQLSFSVQHVLACGSEMKNTFCVTKDQYAFVSQHIGDLNTLETLAHFEKVLRHYLRLFRVNPVIVAYDKHPDYLSTQYARDLGENDPSLVLIPVQHHHAHIVSCLTENRVQPPVIGVAFDGTGYGEDGAIWGGEFLYVHHDHFSRLGHLEYVPIPGGDAATKKPYRLSVGYLFHLLGREGLDAAGRFFSEAIQPEIAVLQQQMARGINCPLTSSAGRLFDAVSALLGICTAVDYEGQAAIELEMAADPGRSCQRTYSFTIRNQNGVKILMLRSILAAVLEDLAQGVSAGEIALRFHHTVALMIAEMCSRLSQETGIEAVALSGGVFQNRLLTGLVRRLLQQRGLAVYTHQHVPCNDGGLSL
ncbi:MAG TPA: carbamoyltransferase HypF, partial [Thermodesulfobacteriota bacterium]|nr:carbamoyltransferase HypF [Thermodesulfobacteriota bacterium]